MSNKACLQTLQNVKRQWAEASLTELSAMEEGVAVVLTGNQIFPSNNQKVTYTAIASEGMDRELPESGFYSFFAHKACFKRFAICFSTSGNCGYGASGVYC